MSVKKQWPGKEKLAIMLQGLKGDCRIGTLCNDHGITQGMYYKWRDQRLGDGAKLFERGGVDHIRERLEHENRKLKETIGELSVELKTRLVRRRSVNSSASQALLMQIQQLKAEHPYWRHYTMNDVVNIL
ncbi:MAG: transposase [Verrucomicrobiota bacterium]|jgi:transposase-like protein|nr:transposase [Verrucomicrobiota bacterium]